MATMKAKAGQRETIASCRQCARTHIMRGKAAQLKRALEIVMEVEWSIREPSIRI